MDNSLARIEILDIQARIDRLNDEKSQFIRAWEGEKERQQDPDLPQPEEIRIINKRLGPLYGDKEALLDAHPYLQSEFGKKKQSKPGKSPLGCSPTAQANKAAKKARYLANKEAKKEENRRRAAANNSGTGKGRR